LNIVLSFDQLPLHLDLALVAPLLAALTPRRRDEAIQAIAEVSLRVAAAQIFAAPGICWEDCDSEGRVVVTFSARPAHITILDLTFCDAPERLGGGRFVIEAPTTCVFAIPSEQGPSAWSRPASIVCADETILQSAISPAPEPLPALLTTIVAQLTRAIALNERAATARDPVPPCFAERWSRDGRTHDVIPDDARNMILAIRIGSAAPTETGHAATAPARGARALPPPSPMPPPI